MMYMRSADLFLGVPFNIASTALLAMIIGKVMGMKINEICVSICDCHLYEEHLDAVKEQLGNEREIFESPSLEIIKDIDINSSIEEKIKWIEELTYEDFSLKNYKCHNTIKAVMK